MRLAIVISVSEPETAWNALRLGNFARKQGDDVSVFFMGPGVDAVEAGGRASTAPSGKAWAAGGAAEASSERFDVKGQAEDLLRQGGKLLACGTCLKLREREGSEVCPLSSMKDLYGLVRDSDRVVTF